MFNNLAQMFNDLSDSVCFFFDNLFIFARKK